MKDVVVGAFCPLRCFAALPRNLAPLWGWMGDAVVAESYPFAFLRLWRETRSTMEKAGDAVVGVSSPLITNFGSAAGRCWRYLLGLPCLAALCA